MRVKWRARIHQLFLVMKSTASSAIPPYIRYCIVSLDNPTAALIVGAGVVTAGFVVPVPNNSCNQFVPPDVAVAVAADAVAGGVVGVVAVAVVEIPVVVL